MTPIFTTAHARLGPAELSAAARTNRRRRWVFVATLLLACAASLGWVYSRPAEYEATARWQFVFAARDEPQPAAPAQEPNPAFLTEVQVITSRPLLEKLQAEMQARGLPLPAPTADGADGPVDALQRSLRVLPVPGTTVVQVLAEGSSPQPLAPAINTLFEVYRQQLDESHRFEAGDALVKARDEAAALDEQVDRRRREIDAFRARHNIVSLESDESPVLSQLKGQSTALNLANDKVVAAESKLRSLHESISVGRPAARTQGDAALDSLEQRLSQAREQLQVMERTYTDAYFALDPDAKALRARVAALDEQLRQARAAAQRGALAGAEQELAGARLAATRIAQQMNSARQGVQTYTARLAEYKTMREALDRLEAQRGDAAARATALETSSRRVAPVVRVLEAASPPQRPVRPDYARDAALAAGGSLLLALLAVGLVELLTRPEEDMSSAILHGSWGAPLPAPIAGARQPIALDTVSRDLPDEASPAVSPPPPLLHEPAAALPLPRELDASEITALLDAAQPSARTLLMALLSGLTAGEAAALNWRDVELSVPALRLADRRVPLAAPLVRTLSTPLAMALGGRVDERYRPDAPVFAGADGRRRQSPGEIDAAVTVAAHDAGLPAPGEVDAALLRHAYIAHLVRQGARFGDLARWVGPVASQALAAYAQLAPAGPKRPADQVDPVLPVLRGFQAS